MKAWRWAAMASVCAALAFTGCGGSDDDDDGGTADADISGHWSGQWSQSGGLTGSWTLDLGQAGSNITGTDSIDGTDGQITGVVDGNDVALTSSRPGDDVTTALDLTVDGDTMTGTWADVGEADEGTVIFTRD